MTPLPAVKSALILLAGNHPRHWSESEQAPFGLMEINGCTLFGHTVDYLFSMGVTKIVIVTGRMSRSLQRLDQFPNVDVVWDPLYADFGSMYAIRQASALLRMPFLLIESNLLFERRLLELAVGIEPTNGVVVSQGRSLSQYICAEAVNERLLGLFATRDNAAHKAEGGLCSLGLFKISRDLFSRMLTYALDRAYTNPFLDHTECLNGVAADVEIQLVREPNLLWAQIQSRADMRWALHHVYPLIIQQDAQWQQDAQRQLDVQWQQ